MSSTTTTAEGRLVREWERPSQPWATMLIVHGLGEHSGRYEDVGEQLSIAGVAVRAFDLKGFGGSAGTRAYIEDFTDYLSEIAHELDASRLPDVPAVLMGHSLGGLLAYRYAVSDAVQPDRLILSSPALGSSISPVKRVAAPLIAKVAPRLSLPNEIKGDQLSRDPLVGEAYFADPLVYTKTTAALGAGIFGAIDASESAEAPPMPTYVFHGAADTVVPARFSVALGERQGVTRKLYHNLRHETMNEPEGTDVVADVIQWLRDSFNR